MTKFSQIIKVGVPGVVLIRALNGSFLVLGVRKITPSSLGAGGSSSRSRYLVVVEHCCTLKYTSQSWACGPWVRTPPPVWHLITHCKVHPSRLWSQKFTADKLGQLLKSWGHWYLGRGSCKKEQKKSAHFLHFLGALLQSVDFSTLLQLPCGLLCLVLKYKLPCALQMAEFCSLFEQNSAFFYCFSFAVQWSLTLCMIPNSHLSCRECMIFRPQWAFGSTTITHKVHDHQ